MEDGTRVVHAGLPEPRQHEPLLPGPQFSSLYHLSGDPSGHPLEYGRYGNPTWGRWEAALGELERGTAVAFASGMAAVAAVLIPRLAAGDVLLLPADGYPTVRDLASQLPGVEIRTVPITTFQDSLDGAAFVWIESPSNPGLEVCDIAAVCAGAHERGALVAVDNTLATPIGQRPLELGADFSVSSDSKHATGHSDLILGHVAVRSAEHAEELDTWRRMTGAVPGPFEVWLAHRSLATLDVRLERECATALQLAQMLAERADVAAVRYPGLPDDPSHELAARQMTRFGSIVVFDVGDRSRAERFLAACSLVAEATSFGGVHSSAERRARWSGNDVPEGFIRFSVGCETAADLLADVEQALDRSLSANR
ncbi:MAG: cystathionine gamma-lyase [Thermoleophilaceae bacterium]|nr:cystathionine gamma-lyase [Thermoleophilaceae bacterium]